MMHILEEKGHLKRRESGREVVYVRMALPDIFVADSAHRERRHASVRIEIRPLTSRSGNGANCSWHGTFLGL
jgi:hypothetical protein